MIRSLMTSLALVHSSGTLGKQKATINNDGHCIVALGWPFQPILTILRDVSIGLLDLAKRMEGKGNHLADDLLSIKGIVSVPNHPALPFRYTFDLKELQEGQRVRMKQE